MQHEDTITEVEGAKGASTIASAADASVASALDVHGAMSGGGGAGGAVASPQRDGTSRSDAAASELRVITGGAAEAPSPPVGDEQDDEEVETKRPRDDRPRSGQDKDGTGQGKKHTNNLRKLRIERMMSKAELARRANLSVLTIDRIEKGFGCRMDSKRKILEALGLSLADRVRVFGEEE